MAFAELFTAGVTALKASLLSNPIGTKVGSAATLRAGFGGILAEGRTSVGNVGTGEDTLLSYSLEANALNADGAEIEIVLSGVFAANGNSKTLKVKWAGQTIPIFGGSATLGPASVNNGLYDVRLRIKRISSTHVRPSGVVVTYTGIGTVVPALIDRTTIATTFSGAVTILVTGEATSDNDITLTDYTVSWRPAVA